MKFKESITRKVSTALALRAKRLIVFLTPGRQSRSGGVLSISYLYRESAAMRDIHQARVVLCTVPGDPHLNKYTWFENQNYVLDLEALLRRSGRLESLMLHIPEYAVNQVISWLGSASTTLMRNIREVHLNVLIQNIDLIELIQGRNLNGLKRFGKVTCTTAHEAYTTLATRNEMGVPLHRLSVWLGPELYSRWNYEDKEPILIVSHDDHPLKQPVLAMIAQALPGLRIQVIQNLVYEDYRKLICRAKWSVTFGEGLDGYFAEPVLSGSVGFAVFNERFFTPAFAQLETVYPSWEILQERIVADMKRLDEPVAYNRCWRQAYDLLNSLYSTERFRENLRMFYRGEYTFP